MSQPRSLVIVDCTAGAPDAGLLRLWEESGFLGRVRELGGPVFAWTAGEAVQDLPSLADAEALNQALSETETDRLILVDPTQVFLDVALVQTGLKAFDPKDQDQFTQWEHCRLPVGVGVRALSVRTWKAADAESPMAVLDQLRAEPAGRRFAYDVAQRVSYEDSLLDSRAGKGLGQLLASQSVGSWDMAGFLALVEEPQRAALRYRPAEVAARVDERQMAAPYGFESDACADFPTYVMFDITNICNARCIHCPQSIRDEDGNKPAFLTDTEHQSLEVFKEVIDECAKHDVRFVRITADGEPLVHPAIFEMLEYAQERGVGPVGLTTNGSLLTPARAERLVNSGVSVIDFSLDAIKPETFATVRVGLNFKKTTDNVLHFIDLVNERKAPVKVMVSFVKQAANVDEVEAFREYWGPKVEEVVVREMISNVGLNDPSTSTWPGWDARWPCAHFFRRVVINHRGMLKACPIDWEQRTVNKPVREENLFDQWHGDFYWKHRLQHLNDAIVDSSACKKCPDWAGTPWELGYEKIIQRLTETMEIG